MSRIVRAAFAYILHPTFSEGVARCAAISARSSATAAGSTFLR